MNTNKIILGTVQMGLTYGINNTIGKISLEDSHAILKEAYLSGIRTLDTAEAYGNAHEVIGSFHKAYPDYKFKIITKLPHQLNSGIREKIDKYINELHVLQVDCLMFHAFNTYSEHPEAVETLLGLKREKKILSTGVSIYSNEEFARVIEDGAIDVIQLPFNLLDNYQMRGELLKKAKTKGKTIHTRSAFLQGLFFKDSGEKHKIAHALTKELNVLQRIIQREKIEMASLALNYCLQQDSIDNVLIGVDSLHHLKQNISITKSFIPASILEEIGSIKVENIDLLNPSLWN